jgi:glycosyltransferase involved in cell wall biosynthesis
MQIFQMSVMGFQMPNSVTFTSRVFNENKGGNTRYALELCKGLNESGWNTEIEEVSSNRYLSLMQEVSIGTFRKHKLIHFLCDTGQLFRSRSTTVTTVHGIASLHNFGIRSNSAEFVWRKRVQLALRHSDLIITPSESSRLDLLQVFDLNNDKVHVIRHGIDHANFHPNVNELDEELLGHLRALPSEYLLYIGNLDPRKNLKTLITATESLRWPRDFKLVIVGKFAWGERELITRISTNTEVIYLGQLDDKYIAPLYRKARLFIFPSLYEGFGFPVLEALACGAPVLTTSKGNLETFRISGHPIIEDPLNPSEIVSKVLEALNLSIDRGSFVSPGIDLANKYHWSSSVKSHIRLYSGLFN